MAKTRTPSKATRPKAKAPKKPSQLDRIERSIGSIESKLSTLNAWEMLNEAMSEAKLASPTVAVEEKWVPKVNALAVYDGIVGMVDAHSANVGDWWSIHGRWVPTHKLSSPSPEEIASHEAKVKAEAQAAEDAKLVFGARVEHISRGKGIWMGMDGILHELAFLNHGEGRLHQWSIVTCPRLTFTLLP